MTGLRRLIWHIRLWILVKTGRAYTFPDSESALRWLTDGES